MKIFITGVTGFVGGCAANYFIKRGHKVSGIGRKKNLPPHVLPACNYAMADITQPIKNIDADVVIHAAAVASDTASYFEMYQANVQGTENVLYASGAAKSFIHISSSSVYHFLDHPMKEDEAGLHVEQLFNYGKTKKQAEEKVFAAYGDFTKIILRPRAIYGQFDQNLLPRLLKLVKGNRLLQPTHLAKQISLTHIDNLLHAIEMSMNIYSSDARIYNVADELVYDLSDILLKLLPAVTGKHLRPFIIPQRALNAVCAINHQMSLGLPFNHFALSSLCYNAVLNIERMKEEMHFTPQKNFYNSYRDIINWIHHEEGWKYYFKHQPKPL